MDEKLRYERALLNRGYRLIAGMDEVGRGPLAGPVVAACVILPVDDPIEGVDDSKELSRKRRAQLLSLIKEKAVAIGIGVVEPEVIDRINILQATRLAMETAVRGMAVAPDYILVDALENLRISQPHRGIIHGDSLSYLVGAASIVAKQVRDAMMADMNGRYPGYGFDRNMGYGTAEHRMALRTLGPCAIHRRSFLGKLL
jgi:ribonuclease HII